MRVCVVGDFKGSFISMLRCLQSLELVNSDDQWIGGDSQVVFLGDMLANRFPSGLECLRFIHQIEKDAEKCGGCFTLIAGNHEEIALSYLIGKLPWGQTDNRLYMPALQAQIQRQGLGLLEFSQYGSCALRKAAETESRDLEFEALVQSFFDKLDGEGRVDERDPWVLLVKEQSRVVANLLARDRGVVGQIQRLRLVHRHGPALFLHCPPSAAIVEYLTQGDLNLNIGHANGVFSSVLESGLLGRGLGRQEERALDEYSSLSELFLCPGNLSSFRQYPHAHRYARKLIRCGISFVFFAHGGATPQFSLGNGRTSEKELQLIPLDFGATLETDLLAKPPVAVLSGSVLSTGQKLLPQRADSI